MRQRADLRDEIAARGYLGGRKSVRRFLNTLARYNGPRAVPPPPPAVADVVRWIIGRPENQNDQARQDLKDVCGRCPENAEACRLVRGFATILRRLDGHRLGEWLAQADESKVKEIRTFANGLRKDLAAVTAGLTPPLSSGAVEGNVTRIKLLKRQHYGRAGFNLLKRRILLARRPRASRKVPKSQNDMAVDKLAGDGHRLRAPEQRRQAAAGHGRPGCDICGTVRARCCHLCANRTLGDPFTGCRPDRIRGQWPNLLTRRQPSQTRSFCAQPPRMEASRFSSWYARRPYRRVRISTPHPPTR
ncbi:transposase [Streptomyces spinosisporus]|uniref:transposase n=1 Tax=Streptomyces spinosisporus TaxID=2927582 RepID=UPI003558537D